MNDSPRRVRELIADECPAIDRDCVDGTAGGARYFNAAFNYVRARFPDAQLAFTYGSTARGNPTSFSDIDLYVILAGESGLRAVEVFEGLPLEARVMSRETVELLLALPAEVVPRASFLATALEDSKLVCGSEPLWQELRGRALRWLSACPKDLSIDVIAMHRTRTTNRVLDLASERLCSYRRIKAAYEITDSIRILSNHERGLFQGRNLVDHLAVVWPERAAELRAAIDAMLQRNDPIPLVQLAIRALEPYGGLLVDRFWSKEPAVVRRAPAADPLHRAA